MALAARGGDAGLDVKAQAAFDPSDAPKTYSFGTLVFKGPQLLTMLHSLLTVGNRAVAERVLYVRGAFGLTPATDRLHAWRIHLTCFRGKGVQNLGARGFRHAKQSSFKAFTPFPTSISSQMNSP